MNIMKLAEENRDYVINLRRYFHEHPEPSLQEFKTCAKVCEELTKLGIAHKVVGDTGVVASIGGKLPGKTLILRADMDALQVTECTGVDYASKTPGMMHACGHDGHTAMLLGAAKILKENEDKINGTIKLYFQPAEEIAQGALKMFKEEPIDEADGCFAIHLWADIPTGQISVEAGPRMAAADILKIELLGKSGHGSLPHQTIDPVVAGSALVMNLQSIVAREMNPNEAAVVSIGSFHSGTRFNVIANKATLEGTVRTFSQESRNYLEGAIRRIVRATCDTYRTTSEISYIYGTNPVINDENCADIAEKAVEKILSRQNLHKFDKLTGAEDFCYYTEKVPGILAFVGVGNPEKGADYPHHHEKFNMDEDGLIHGTALYCQYAVEFLDTNN